MIEGVTVLIVEDSALSAMAMERVLRKAGATVVGPYSTVAEATNAIGECDVAILDIQLGEEKSYELARALIAAGTPCAFLSGFTDPPDLPADLRDVPRLAKPLVPDALRRAVEELLRAAE